MTAISYIWAAEQTEPGANGVRYTATNTNAQPAAIAPVQAHAGLVHAESLFSDWQLIGTAKGTCYSNDYGTFIELDTPANEGAPVEVEEVVRLSWYMAAQ